MILLVSVVQQAALLRLRIPWPTQLERIYLMTYQAIAPFRIVNRYGLFAVMTTERPEVEIEGTVDGETWLAYEFPYKLGPLDRPPPWVAPHMPRLDWQQAWLRSGLAQMLHWRFS